MNSTTQSRGGSSSASEGAVLTVGDVTRTQRYTVPESATIREGAVELIRRDIECIIVERENGDRAVLTQLGLFQALLPSTEELYQGERMPETRPSPDDPVEPLRFVRKVVEPRGHSAETGVLTLVPETVTITDNRTGKSVEVPVENGGIDMAAIQKLMPGTWVLDPGFGGTASTTSAITDLDGTNGILRYRGYPIEQLAEHSTFLEVCYLLLFSELPDKKEMDTWVHDVTYHTFIHENMRKRFMEGFHHDAHPMGMLMSAIAALSTFYPEAKDIFDAENRYKQINRLISKAPTLAAMAYRASIGMPFVYPDNELSYAENFLSMMWRVAEPQYKPDPVLSKALDVLLILHADHEQNCSTTTMRIVGSSHADPYSAASAATAALYGPRHGGANEAVIHMLEDIGSYDNIDAFVESVKNGEGRLMGFGHRVYKAYDPRARIVKEQADHVFEVTGKSPLLDIARKLEEIALEDDYFKSRNLYPNVDFYTGLIYQAMGFPLDMFTVLFTIGRMPGWLAHWQELLEQNQRIARPRQIYTGPEVRDYVALGDR